MDLLEIRKKAKGLKGAEGKGEAVPKPESPAGKKKKKASPKKAVAPSAAPAADDKAEEAVAATADAAETGPALSGDEEAVFEAAAATGQDGGAAAEAAQAAEAPAEEDDDIGLGFGGAGREADEETVEYLAFMLSGEEYAVKVEDVKEIIRQQQLTAVPRAPDFVLGITSLRGVILPVFDIRTRLGLERSERTKFTRIIVVSDGGAPQGIIVDKVTGVARLGKDTIEPPPSVIGGVDAEYLEGVGRLGDRLLILFNTSQVLSTEG